MNSPLRILIIGDKSQAEDDIASVLDSSALDPVCLPDAEACIRYMARQSTPAPGLVLSNPSEADRSSLHALRTLRAAHPHVLLAVTGYSFDPSFIEETSKAGVLLLRKPISPRDIEGLITRIRLNVPPAPVAVNSSLYVEDLKNDGFFLAASPVMHDILSKINIIAPTDVSVLITGESGVGKEVVAQLLHKHSARAHRPLLKVNCAALPNDLLESELFGYEAGAFTGAMKAKPGKFDLCDKGTILLDEIGEMSPQMQAKLLHVLQDGEFARLGSRASTKVDVRVVAATNIDMEKCIADRTFREDLYYRLNAFVLHIPPLRERRQEIPYLLHEMSQRLATVYQVEPLPMSGRLISAALQYNWPGNLRELGNFVKRYLILRDEVVALVDLESKIMRQVSTVPMPMLVTTSQSHHSSQETTSPDGLKGVVRNMKDAAETQMIREVLRQNRWNRRMAAEQLKISYKALLYKIRKYELDISDIA
jgi:two-component system, NtrC family, response regulator AtoC